MECQWLVINLLPNHPLVFVSIYLYLYLYWLVFVFICINPLPLECQRLVINLLPNHPLWLLTVRPTTSFKDLQGSLGKINQWKSCYASLLVFFIGRHLGYHPIIFSSLPYTRRYSALCTGHWWCGLFILDITYRNKGLTFQLYQQVFFSQRNLSILREFVNC